MIECTEHLLSCINSVEECAARLGTCTAREAVPTVEYPEVCFCLVTAYQWFESIHTRSIWGDMTSCTAMCSNCADLYRRYIKIDDLSVTIPTSRNVIYGTDSTIYRCSSRTCRSITFAYVVILEKNTTSITISTGRDTGCIAFLGKHALREL